LELNKISLIFTVKNEEKSIQNLLESIIYQTKKPDEIIIVDGGSVDNTIKIIKKYQKKLPIKLIIRKGANVPEGRNIAISQAKNKIIAVTDGGCILDQNWIKEITKPLKNEKIDIVSGKYIVTGSRILQKLIGKLLMYDFNKVDSNSFSPSSRSIAFRKKVWEEVNGYPEWLISGEDTYFNRKLREKGKQFYLNKKAIVYWEARESFSKLFKQYYQYAYYDAIGLNNLGSYFLRIIFWLIFGFFILEFYFFNLFWLLFILFFLCIIITLIRIIYKLRTLKNSFKVYFFSFLIYFIFDTALFLGFLNGLFKNILTTLLTKLKKR